VAFEHGSKAQVLVNGYDLSPFLRSFSSPASVEAVEVTTFGATAKSYIPGLLDATLTAEGLFDGAAQAVDEILAAALGKKDSIWNWYPQGGEVGKRGYGFAAIETSYEVETPVDGVAAVSVEAQSSVGREPVVVLHELREEAIDGSGTIIDNGAATNNGGVGYLHVAQITGSVLVTIEHSSDNFVADVLPLITFTLVNASRKAERVAVSGTVKRYVRVKWDITGGPATFHVAFGRK
jgi:hypothetical protein